MNNKLEIKERLRHLTPEEREKLSEYVDAVKEIKKEIKELLSKKDTIAESGGNRSSDLIMNVREEGIDLNEYDQLLGAIENLLNQGESSQNILRVVKDTLGYE
jgi:uncharacterized membrane protein YvbJ